MNFMRLFSSAILTSESMLQIRLDCTERVNSRVNPEYQFMAHQRHEHSNIPQPLISYGSRSAINGMVRFRQFSVTTPASPRVGSQAFCTPSSAGAECLFFPLVLRAIIHCHESFPVWESDRIRRKRACPSNAKSTVAQPEGSFAAHTHRFLEPLKAQVKLLKYWECWGAKLEWDQQRNSGHWRV